MVQKSGVATSLEEAQSAVRQNWESWLALEGLQEKPSDP